MPPPKIIGQVLQEKKDIVKEIQRRKRKKKQCSQRKKKTFFLFEILAAYTTRYSPEDPLRAKKKEQSHLPCQVQTCPTGATKGQLISKSLFAVIVSTKLATKIL